MNEYEYSFKVESIKPYIKYCEDNNYVKESVVSQNRIVFENKYSEDIIARITKKVVDGKNKSVFDVKNVGLKKDDLKESMESQPLVITSKNEKIINSILEVLNFYEAANNHRTRYVYVKNNVKFEIDDYITPKMQVVGIEGEKEAVDRVYKELIENQVGVILEDN